MEEREEEGSSAKTVSSYRYWVRGPKEDDVPLPEPKKLNAGEYSPKTTPLGSVWNQAGTWEEKSLNKWALQRLKDLILSVGHLDFSTGRARISDLSKCDGDAYLVTVRNKKRVGYSYELSLKVKGEWTIGDETKPVKANLDIPEISFGEIDVLEFEVRLNDDLSQPEKSRITDDLKLFLQPLREKLIQFEQELKDR